MGILSGNRFWLGLGSGENLNEHVVGRGWPAVGVRHEMLSEAVDIIAELLGSGERVNYRADLPNPESFAAATQFVTPDQVGSALGCGPDVAEHVEKIRPFIDAGFTEIALVQIGADEQAPFIAWAEQELLPALRSL